MDELIGFIIGLSIFGLAIIGGISIYQYSKGEIIDVKKCLRYSQKTGECVLAENDNFFIVKKSIVKDKNCFK